MSKHPAPDERFFRSANQMFAALTELVVSQLEKAIGVCDCVSLVACGGTTPAPLYDRLAERSIEWSKVWITLSDERWIDARQDGSNEKFIRERLMRGEARAAGFVPLKTPDALPEDAEATVSAAIAAMPRPFDIALLGMGVDGHTASLFPHAPGLTKALNTDSPLLVGAIHPPHEAFNRRMSLTLRAILESRLIAILIRGEAKMKTYHAALAGDDVEAMPVRAVLQQNSTPVQVFWAP